MGGVSKSVVREHYYLVCAVVYDDGSHEWNHDVSIVDNFDLGRPVFDMDSQEWVRVTDDLLNNDDRLGRELADKLDSSIS